MILPGNDITPRFKLCVILTTRKTKACKPCSPNVRRALNDETLRKMEEFF